jgi:hypothetical protein
MPALGDGQLFDLALKYEQRGNRDARDLWDRYAGHRQRLTAAALALAPPGTDGRACFLGAGNGNDLDLEALAARFAEVHLVDIDASALSRATGRQPPETRAKLRCHAPVDLSGLYRQLDAGRGKVPPFARLVEMGAGEVIPQLPADFDLVVSCCVLSQMSWALARVVPEEHKALLEQALVSIHLRTLHALCAPGRPALVAADLISSDSYPLEEAATGGADLRALVDELAAANLAYAVNNPVLLRQIIRRDQVLSAGWAPPEVGDPWLWTGSLDRTYLVYPLVLRRR